jgi:methionyl-tRNA synthetase
LNLEGNKLSTSKKTGQFCTNIWKKFPNQQDVLRYVPTSNAPETKIMISLERFSGKKQQ